MDFEDFEDVFFGDVLLPLLDHCLHVIDTDRVWVIYIKLFKNGVEFLFCQICLRLNRSWNELRVIDKIIPGIADFFDDLFDFVWSHLQLALIKSKG